MEVDEREMPSRSESMHVDLEEEEEEEEEEEAHSNSAVVLGREAKVCARVFFVGVCVFA